MEASRRGVRAAQEARVTADFGRRYLVEDAQGNTYAAVRRGKRTDVAVGDVVEVTLASATDAVIERVLPRTNLLMRADGVREKTLAANVDQVAVVFASAPPFSEEFLWRALLAAHGAGIPPLAILNKTDLPEQQRARAALARLQALGVATLAVSAQAEGTAARAALIERLRSQVTLLVGQSGMGKSTLLNLLVPQANARTQDFSRRLNLGRQTTTATRWYALPEGGALIDSPGFQSFGLAHLDARTIAEGMSDFTPYLGGCRFNDCLHLDEPGCAVRAAVEQGAIEAARYLFYRDLLAARP
ncbi:MAG: ribosome small subunit-dependent GTPase A [Sutterellaceae bacterium]|nr:ribosome small subunit-dependent GTPase A [Burkholderiaceae bacterium]MCX7901009.1 ribosome small subunit-dependent GTPase A [Burkholderiaceae bacterium]MDW8430365.1 ribosome small subunit-dependent GTPase A [Sutterellaceae bacterium]